MTGPIWVDGRLLDSNAPALLASDRGVTVGLGLFETAKVVGGQAFALSRHLRRLARSAPAMELPDPDLEWVRSGVAALLSAVGPMPIGRLRITLTAGPGRLETAGGSAAATYVIQAAAQEPPQPTGTAVTAPWVRNERSAVAGLKTTSYAENVLALAYARDRGAGEALLANTRGELCEGTTSNVIVGIGGRLVTPPLSSGALPGIGRELLLEWAAGDGWPIAEELLPFAVLADADEVLLTSSIRDVQPLHAVDDRVLRAPGELGELGARAAALFATRAAEGMDP
jgi:branched-chain amino acid aminotransferase